jgi:hypothetical protein
MSYGSQHSFEPEGSASSNAQEKSVPMAVRTLLIVGAVVVVPLSAIGSCDLHDRLLASAFNRVAIGMARQDVLAVMGKPWRVPQRGKADLLNERLRRGEWQIR